MSIPCTDETKKHRHTVTWTAVRTTADTEHDWTSLGEVRGMTALCTSPALWATTARGVLLGHEVTLDGRPLDWPDAREFLSSVHPSWMHGLPVTE